MNLNQLCLDPCSNCGDCCKIPGLFLPNQIVPISKHLGINTEELVKKYLIFELCSSNPDLIPPVFVPSPVKISSEGERFPGLLMDDEYINTRHFYCIFRDGISMICKIHPFKPFGCALLTCEKMTRANSLFLNKQYYYHKWKDHQNIIFEIFPDLKSVHEELVSVLKAKSDNNQKRNDLINNEISLILNKRNIRFTKINA